MIPGFFSHRFLTLLLIAAAVFMTIPSGVMGESAEIPSTVPSDVPRDHWAYESLTHLYRLGIVKGYPEGIGFRGDRPLTRYEFAVALKHLMEKAVVSGEDFPGAERGKLAALVSLYRKELLDLGARLEDLTRDFRLLLSVVGSNTEEIKGLEQRVRALETGSGLRKKAGVWSASSPSGSLPKGSFHIWADHYAPSGLSGFADLSREYRRAMAAGYAAEFMGGPLELALSVSEWENDSFTASRDFKSGVDSMASVFSIGDGTYGGATGHLEMNTIGFTGIWIPAKWRERKFRPRFGLGLARNRVSLWLSPMNGSGIPLYTMYARENFFSGSLVTGFETDLFQGFTLGVDGILEFGSRTLIPDIHAMTQGGTGSGTSLSAVQGATVYEALPWDGLDLDLSGWQLRTSARMRFR